MVGAIPPTKTNSDKAPDAPPLHQQLPPWFIAIFAMSYVTGYLIEYLYYASLGIVDTAGDIFKLKYIQTGMIFLFSCALITTYVIVMAGTPRLNMKLLDPPQTAWYMSRWIVFAVMFNVLSIYISVMFTPLHYVETTAQWAGILSLAILFILFGILYNWTERQYNDSYLSMKDANSGAFSEVQKQNLRGRWNAYIFVRDVAAMFFLGMVVLSDIVFLRAREVALLDLVSQGGWIFVSLAILVPILVYRIVTRLELVSEAENKNSGFLYYTITGAGGVVLSLLLFVVLVSYSYWVFPFIPSLKGGGDYENASTVSVVLKRAERPRPDRRDELNSKDLDQSLILYSTASSYYLARPVGKNNPCEWRTGRARPQITEVRRDEIRALVFTGGSRKSNCE